MQFLCKTNTKYEFLIVERLHHIATLLLASSLCISPATIAIGAEGGADGPAFIMNHNKSPLPSRSVLGRYAEASATGGALIA